MGWQRALNYAKELTEKRGWTESNREDEGLPMNARIGSVMQVQLSPFITASAQGSLVEVPVVGDRATGDFLIKAISRINTNLTGSLYRFYIDVDAAKNRETFVQIYTNEQGEIQEAIYFHLLTRLYPETEEDQQIYRGELGYGLGDKGYSLWRYQLEELGMPAAQLDASFNEQETLDYVRDAGDASAEFVSPYKGVEVRLDDAQGKNGLQQDIHFMPYRRESMQYVEYLLISTEVVTRVNDNERPCDIHVDFMVGLPLDIERIRIL